MGRWAVLLRRRSGGAVVFVDESAEASALADPVDGNGFGRRLVDAVGGALVDAAVGPVGVVVHGELDDQASKLAFVPDQRVAQQFGSAVRTSRRRDDW